MRSPTPTASAAPRSPPFDASAPFSMTEGAALVLRADGSVTGFNQAMETGVPEPSTWAMLIIGFAGLAWAGLRRAQERAVRALKTVGPEGSLHQACSAREVSSERVGRLCFQAEMP